MPTSSPSFIVDVVRPGGLAHHVRRVVRPVPSIWNWPWPRPWIHRPWPVAVRKLAYRHCRRRPGPRSRSRRSALTSDRRPFKVPSWKCRARGTPRCGRAAPARSPPCRRDACGRTGRRMPRVAGRGRCRSLATDRCFLAPGAGGRHRLRERRREVGEVDVIGCKCSGDHRPFAVEPHAPSVPSRVSRPSFTATAGQERPAVCRTTAALDGKRTQQRTEGEIEAAPAGEVAHGCRLEQALAAEARIGSTLDRRRRR